MHTNAVQPDDINLHCGVAGEVGALNLHLFSESAVNTTSERLATSTKNYRAARLIAIRPNEVRPLAGILDQHLPVGQSIELMSIDVEGSATTYNSVACRTGLRKVRAIRRFRR